MSAQAPPDGGCPSHDPRHESRERRKRLKAGVAAQIDHVEPVELSKEAAHQLFPDSLVSIVGQHLEEWNEGAEDTVTDCRHESNNSVAIKSKLHRIAPAQEIELLFGCRLSGPVDEESAELVGTDRLGAIDVRDHAGDPSPDENRRLGGQGDARD